MNERTIRYASLLTIYASLATPAHAYIDGATASIILQAVIGGIATWVVYSKALVARGRSFMLRIVRKGEVPGAE